MEYIVYAFPSEDTLSPLWTIGTSIASVFIALCAVTFSWLQIKKTDKHNRLMVTPHLSTTSHIDVEKGTLKITLENNGVGPAVIIDFEIKISGNIVKGEDEVESALNLLLAELPGTSWGHESLTRNSFLPAGQKIELAIIVNKDISPEKMIETLDPKFTLKIAYNSIYGEPFKFDSHD